MVWMMEECCSVDCSDGGVGGRCAAAAASAGCGCGARGSGGAMVRSYRSCAGGVDVCGSAGHLLPQSEVILRLMRQFRNES